jgi:copper chaperone CopZ
MKTRMKIAKLTEPADATHIEKALEAVPNVRSVQVDVEENEALVQHEGAEESELTAAVKSLGYLATIERGDA